ncbi:hypothetical protein NX059_009833 [Plenodomus lindquistii]|nr:hypothetical protein NX059_009833 [Plenodomus lindquistii]
MVKYIVFGTAHYSQSTLPVIRIHSGSSFEENLFDQTLIRWIKFARQLYQSGYTTPPFSLEVKSQDHNPFLHLPSMKAFEYADGASGLRLKEVPIPDVKPDGVLIQIKAAGMCHTDSHIVAGHGDAWLMKRPIILGHEAAGEIIKTGANVSQYSVGDRVAVLQISQPFERRDWLLSLGLGFDGGYAEYAAVPASRLVRIPEKVSYAQAAVAMDALATSYEAVVVRGGTKRGSTIGIIGLGGLGMSGLAFGVIEGATVYGFDVDTSKFEEAKSLGAKKCLKSPEDAEGVIFDLIIDFVGLDQTVGAACNCVKPTGTVVVVGLASKTVAVPIQKLVNDEVTLIGSLGASEETAKRVLELLEQGSIVPKLVEVPFDAIPSTLTLLADHSKSTEGRYWTDPTKAA